MCGILGIGLLSAKEQSVRSFLGQPASGWERSFVVVGPTVRIRPVAVVQGPKAKRSLADSECRV